MENRLKGILTGGIATALLFSAYGFVKGEPSLPVQANPNGGPVSVDGVTFFEGRVIYDTSIPKGNDYPATASSSTPVTMWVCKGSDGKLKLSYVRHGDKGNAHAGIVVVDVRP